MDQQLTDKTGAQVSVALDESTRPASYAVFLADGTVTGRAYFIPASDGARIFYHTTVPKEFGGRGLGGVLVREALAETAQEGITVVPMCPFVAGYLDEHAEEFTADGGNSREVTDEDSAAVHAATSHD